MDRLKITVRKAAGYGILALLCVGLPCLLFGQEYLYLILGLAFLFLTGSVIDKKRKVKIIFQEENK